MKKNIALFFGMALFAITLFSPTMSYAQTASSTPSHEQYIQGLQNALNSAIQLLNQLVAEMQTLSDNQGKITTQLQTMAQNSVSASPVAFGSSGSTPSVYPISINIGGTAPNQATTTLGSIGGNCGGIIPSIYVTYNGDAPHTDTLIATFPDGSAHTISGNRDDFSTGQEDYEFTYTPQIQSGNEALLIQAGNVEGEIDITVTPPDFSLNLAQGNAIRLNDDGENYTVVTSGKTFSTTTNSCN